MHMRLVKSGAGCSSCWVAWAQHCPDGHESAMSCQTSGFITAGARSVGHTHLSASRLVGVGAGDRQAAALALAQFSSDVQHQQQLLAVRQERAASKENSTADKSRSSPRQELQLHGAEQYAALAKFTADPV